MDRQEAAAVVVGMEQGQLLAAVNAILGVVDVEHDAARHPLEAVAKQLDQLAAIIRLSAVAVGKFSSRHMVGCEHSSVPASGSRPTPILNAGSVRRASQSLASA